MIFAFYPANNIWCLPTTPPEIEMDMPVFEGGEGCKIYVPTSSVDAYKAAGGWSYYAGVIEGYDFTE